MGKAPSTWTAATMLAVFLCFASDPIQAGNCSFCLCGTSSDCTESDDCLGSVGCDSTAFTVPCDGMYQFESKVKCFDEGDECARCQSCATIYFETGEYVANEHNTHCDTGECSHRSTVHLKAGQHYILKVCLMTCDPFDDCSECGESCKAYGCIWRNTSTPCSPL